MELLSFILSNELDQAGLSSVSRRTRLKQRLLPEAAPACRPLHQHTTAWLNITRLTVLKEL